MDNRVELLPTKKLVGIPMKMSYSCNRTTELWKLFMPRRAEVIHRKTSDYISMQVYDKAAKDMFSPEAIFEKWATVEVSSFSSIPPGMKSYTLQGGKYAVFVHEGPASAFSKTFQFIFGEWLPESGFELDNREHFEVLPEGYSPVDPNAKEEFWVPIIQSI